MGADKEMLRKQFHWPQNRPWSKGEMEQEIERLSDPPALAVLDGINAACGDHGWDVSVASSVGAYRSMFVHPLTSVDCAVLSLGHPVKAPGRQTESYSYGAAGWLNDVDGVSYRLKASKDHPIAKKKEGSSALYSLKDRYGDVNEWGVLQDSGDMPWHYQGSFWVDDTEDGIFGVQHLKVTIPSIDAGEQQDGLDVLGQKSSPSSVTDDPASPARTSWGSRCGPQASSSPGTTWNRHWSGSLAVASSSGPR